MKTTKMLTILVLALGLMVWSAKVSEATPLGTAFTYQGRLIDANSAAESLYDFQFKLYDDANTITGNQLGSTIDINDLDVFDGYFTVELDFGSSVFDGNAVWLEIGVRPGELEDPNVYTVLTPRQEVTPTPYALYAASAGAVPIPLELVGSVAWNEGPGAIIKGTNTGSGYGVYGEASSGRGVYGEATGTTYGTGGHFEASGRYGTGVFGLATDESGMNYGVWGWSKGATGRGVYGYATNSGPGRNYGGYFVAYGEDARGVLGFVGTGQGVQGWASSEGDLINYGGHFTADGKQGRGVYGEATATGFYDVNTYGGYFKADGGSYSHGVYGLAAGTQGRGVAGYASSTGTYENYGGYFEAAGEHGRGVYGEASSSAGENYGVYGKTNSSSGYAGYFEGGRNYFAGNVGIGTASPSAKLDVVGTIQLQDGNEADGNLLVSDVSGNAAWRNGRKYTRSGALNTRSFNATSTFAKIDDFVTFTKDNSGTDIEVVMNTRAFAGTFAGGALGVRFEIRIDNNSTSLDNKGAIRVSNGDEFLSIIAVFQGLSAGSHTVSVWARTNASTSNGVVLDSGGWGGRILVKEVW